MLRVILALTTLMAAPLQQNTAVIDSNVAQVQVNGAAIVGNVADGQSNEVQITNNHAEDQANTAAVQGNAALVQQSTVVIAQNGALGASGVEADAQPAVQPDDNAAKTKSVDSASTSAAESYAKSKDTETDQVKPSTTQTMEAPVKSIKGEDNNAVVSGNVADTQQNNANVMTVDGNKGLVIGSQLNQTVFDTSNRTYYTNVDNTDSSKTFVTNYVTNPVTHQVEKVITYVNTPPSAPSASYGSKQTPIDQIKSAVDSYGKVDKSEVAQVIARLLKSCSELLEMAK